MTKNLRTIFDPRTGITYRVNTRTRLATYQADGETHYASDDTTARLLRTLATRTKSAETRKLYDALSRSCGLSQGPWRTRRNLLGIGRNGARPAPSWRHAPPDETHLPTPPTRGTDKMTAEIARDAIARSISHDEIVTIRVGSIDDAYATLTAVCDAEGWADTVGGYDGDQPLREVWGTTDAGREWRVHLLVNTRA